MAEIDNEGQESNQDGRSEVDSSNPSSLKEPSERLDPKPSGDAFPRPVNVAAEAVQVGSVLVRCIYCALSPTILLVSSVTLLVNSLIWRLYALIFQPDLPFIKINSVDQWLYPTATLSMAGSFDGNFSGSLIGQSLVGQVYYELLAPWQNLATTSGASFFFWLFGCVTTLAIWSLSGTFVCRLLALRFNGKTAKAKSAFHFSINSFVDSFGSVLIPLVAVAILALPLMFAGLFLASNVLSPLGAVLTIVFGMAAIPMAIVLVGLLLCWPLMFPAIAFEGRDCFESISRGYAYVFQRPFHYLGLLITAMIAGIALAWLFAILGDSAVDCLHWGLSWGANAGEADRLAEIIRPVTEGEDSTASVVTWFGSPLVNFWSGVFQLLVRSAKFATFWGFSVGIYLLLRRYLDQTPLDSIFIEGERKLNSLVRESPEADSATLN